MKKVNNYTADLAVQKSILVKNLNDIGVVTGEGELLDTINEKILTIDTSSISLGDLSKTYEIGDNGVVADYYESSGVIVFNGTDATSGYNYIPDYAASTTREIFSIEEKIKYVFLVNITGIGVYGLADLPSCKMIYDVSGLVTTVGDYGCYCDGKLIYTNILDTVTTVGPFGFAGCKKLAAAISKPTTIKANAFANCASITALSLTSATLSEYAFAGCTSLSTLSLTSVTSLPTAVFAGCSALDNITIPTTVTSIADDAFNYCYGLETITSAKTESALTSASSANAVATCFGAPNATISYS